MDNPKYKITLRAKKDFRFHKKGDVVVLINEIFNKDTGVAFFCIDKEFEVISTQLFTGLKDINQVYIFNKDGITTKFSRQYSLGVEYYVKFIDGTFVLVDDYDKPTEIHHLYDNVDFEYEVKNETN